MSTKRKSLGSWFPNASLIKSKSYCPTDKICICLFYQYVKPLWTEDRKNAAITYIEKHAERLNVGGRVRVGTEGLNATISSTEQNIREFTKCLGDFDEHFKGTDFKYMDNLPLDRAFKELKVLPVKELVYYGIHAEEELAEGGIHLEPKDYHQKLAEDNTVVIDVRNAYESDIGRFGAQQSAGGAELLVPDMRKSTDFPAWIEREEIKEKLEGKNVLMYCTGGVRCERASALLKSKFGESVSGVYQLQGGIEKYLQEFPDGGYWQGKNFVFDKREAIGVGCFEGVGGIIQAGKNPNVPAAGKEKPPKKNSSAEVKEAANESAEVKADVMGRCCVCEAPWDRYVGKKKCTMCGVPVLLCVACSSAKGMLDKTEKTASATAAQEKNTEASASTTAGIEPKADAKNGTTGKLSKRQRVKAAEAEKKRIKEEQIQQKLRVLRCPLCVAENITVPADQIVFTANGTRAVHLSAMEESEGGGYYEHSTAGASNKVPAFTAPANAQPANKKIKFGDSGVESAAATAVAKAASTVCKWGGGYSAREEKGKSAKKRKLGVTMDADGGVQRINRPCMYGKECTRGDACWFQH